MSPFRPFPLVLALTLTAGPLIAQDYDRQIRQLTARDDIRRALTVIESTDSQTVADLIELTEIPAPPFQEAARARRYAEMLRALGLDSVRIDAVGNVIGFRPGRGDPGARTVALNAHLDTVFPEGTDVTVRMAGDTLKAPGISDDTRGLATMLAVVRAMQRAGLQTRDNVVFVASVGEEGLGDLRGVKHLFGPDGVTIDAWIAIDGVAIDEITHRGLGSHRYRVTFRGPGGHSWGDFGRVNPHHALGKAIQLFQEAADPFTRTGPRTNYNVGRIGGGTSVNSIPFESWMEVDLRSVSPERLNGIDSILHGSVQAALEYNNALRRQDDPLEVDVQLIGDRPSGSIPESTPLVQRALAVTRHVRVTPHLDIGSTDSNIPISLGIPAITIGGGGSAEEAHSPDEWWLNENGALGIQRALLILAAEAGLTELINDK